MYQVICVYVECVVEKLCEEKQFCCYISVFICISLYVEDEVFYGNQVFGKLMIFINDMWDIIRVVIELLN